MNGMNKWKLMTLVIVFASLLIACGGSADTSAASESGAAETEEEAVSSETADNSPVTVWYHTSGEEGDAIAASIDAYLAANPDKEVVFTILPTGDYNAQVQAAAFSRKLPCLLDFDGPNTYNYAWAGLLVPLDSYVSEEMRADILPSILDQGTFQDGKLYSLGQFDSGLSFWGNKELLEAAGVRIPTVDDPWDLAEFEDALAKLKESGVQWPLDLKLNYGAGEWFTYGLSPIVQSFGGDLINRTDYQSADGVLNGPEAVEALTRLQNWINEGYVNGQQTNDDDFINGDAALSYVGHWMKTTHTEALGDNAILVPVVDFGAGPKTGMGSWNWAITTDCPNPDVAWEVLEFLMSPSEVERISTANGAVPALISVLEADARYAEGGFLNVYFQQLNSGWGEPRPITPAYPAITQAFARAVDNIRLGGDVKTELDAAVQAIDNDIQQNAGYPLN